MPRFLSTSPNAQLLPMPWSTPLAQWPEEHLVALPRGISRHVVRFIRVGDEVYAAKEVNEILAVHEYRMLHDLKRLHTPAVVPISVVSGRMDANGNPLDPILLTKHLHFALPYRSLFTPGVRAETVWRLLDAMVVLLARLHLAGFMWGDASLSNLLFRRDAGEFAAYLVDAETGELHDALSDGQRAQDLDIARLNIFGDFCDLEAGGLLDESLDPMHLVDTIEARYAELWHELTGVEEFSGTELHRIESRVRRLNALGFDVAEFDIDTSSDGTTVRIRPKVVDAGHHSRRLLRLTGLDTEENQARRLLNDMDAFIARGDFGWLEESIAAHRWLTECFETVIRNVPHELHGKRDPAQIYHEVLDYRWYASQRECREVPLAEATTGYVADVLRNLPDEVMSSIDESPYADRLPVDTGDPSSGDQENTEEDPGEEADESATDFFETLRNKEF
ncbi:hypothetical protein HMPREF1531_00326 [Propionibacterium sp. oral taxon 192 str. F0372]|uniref:DUF4032 domain-containing protein n=1 Tax=Propionibacterium sp. oral taxon 192 TaxID=671222 RepID=UPI000354477C|nr:DUF4032 domain-containing protein [Propionibacterium sp. oral taxon 192]EPH07268.1 hypothetical protein HMPREF1531_00326 [Propionibacterium sp. oral taxon 192 str. F0372]